MGVIFGSRLCKSPMAVIYGNHLCKSYLSIMYASHLCQSFMPVIYGIDLWQSDIAVVYDNHLCQYHKIGYHWSLIRLVIMYMLTTLNYISNSNVTTIRINFKVNSCLSDIRRWMIIIIIIILFKVQYPMYIEVRVQWTKSRIIS